MAMLGGECSACCANCSAATAQDIWNRIIAAGCSAEVVSNYTPQQAATIVTPGVGISSQIPTQPDGSPPTEAMIQEREQLALFALTVSDVYVYDGAPPITGTRSLPVDMTQTTFGLYEANRGAVVYRYEDADLLFELGIDIGGTQFAGPTWPGTSCRVSVGGSIRTQNRSRGVAVAGGGFANEFFNSLPSSFVRVTDAGVVKYAAAWNDPPLLMGGAAVWKSSLKPAVAPWDGENLDVFRSAGIAASSLSYPGSEITLTPPPYAFTARPNCFVPLAQVPGGAEVLSSPSIRPTVAAVGGGVTTDGTPTGETYQRSTGTNALTAFSTTVTLRIPWP